jgi:hypothetical protein
MTTVREFHDEAMRLAHLAVVARHGQDWAHAQELSRQAYEYEVQAADLIPEAAASEPTRSILYRSAASLAFQCKEFGIAQRLIAKGLSGYPPPRVEQELKDLYEQINFESHLQVRGVTLDNEDFQLSMQGSSVGYGTILYPEFHNRIVATRLLLDRTIQRVMGAKYQRTGRVAKVFRPFIPALSIPRASSFAITIKLTVSHDEPVPMFITASEVIDEVISCIDLVNSSSEHELRDRIRDDSYYRNFLALTRSLAPDGENIKLVGFTSLRNTVSLTRIHSQIEFAPEVERVPPSLLPRIDVRFHGIMDMASGKSGQESIGLTTDEGQEFTIIVEEGLEDLVRTYFKQFVVVSGVADGTRIYLRDLQPSSE